ncbi:MAG: orotidine-5'-phosphate decarboxylase [Endomicrobiales bacterium]|nr:orotidine-5'-phosphate decarboxylase [Endomicrobiales bacterium]
MKKLIVALDIYEYDKVIAMVKELSNFVDVFKVGPILFLNSGHKIIDGIHSLNKKVFLDLKFHDIPATVRRSVQSAKELGVYSLTLHSCGGIDMLKEAASVEGRPKLWAVTVLTSQASDPQEVIARACLAKSAGVDGVIASPLEIAAIKNCCGKTFEVVTPGIRFSDDKKDDQVRVATPSAAISAGADFIVVGRPIIEAQNPAFAAEKIAKELGE